MTTPKEIQEAANKWALENSDATMVTNSALNKGFISGALHPATEEYYRKKFEAEKKTATELTTNKNNKE